MNAQSFMTCPQGHAMTWNEALKCWVCYVCEEASRWSSAHPDAATREHWGYLLGISDHACGVARHDIPFFPDSDAGRCWLSGWDVAEREEVMESHREKIAAEFNYAREMA